MKIVAKTDQGKVRKDNQDSFAAGELPGGVVWAVVCGGMVARQAEALPARLPLR